MNRFPVSLLMFATAALAAQADEPLHVTPEDDMQKVGARLAADPSITEVVLAGGVYRGGLVIRPIGEGEPASHPLVIRPADGARVVFDGARTITGARPVKGRPGVYSFALEPGGEEAPAVWEPDARVRYTLVADVDAVARFPASHAVVDGRVYFHTSDGLPPGDRAIEIGRGDFGLSILRPHVTVRDLEFRNFVARGKVSAALRIAADHVSIEGCGASNSSFGFIVSGDHGAVVGCTARDVGGGVYLYGAEGRVEDCRLFKERDAFAIPTYEADDTGIHYYFPASGGEVRRNLVVGFGAGILIKAHGAPYLIEQNTLVGRDGRFGMVATEWHPDSVFRRNVIAGFDRPVRIPPAAGRSGLRENCYSLAPGLDPDSIDAGSMVGDPGFERPAAEDYRLGAKSACRALMSPGEPIGAPYPDAAGVALHAPPREWHVSPAGRDGGAGTEAAPVRTIQFAVDRSGPGDTILLHPGIYTDPVTITSGGVAGRPLTVRSVEKWGAILDSGRRAEIMIDIDGAPFVEIRDLEVRWYRRIGIRVNVSADVVVSGCRIWNAHWRGIWPTGVGIQVERSPRFTGDHNVLFRQEHGFMLHTSPASKLTFNTCAGHVYTAAMLIRSIEGSVCRNNSFAFQGNDVLRIDEGPAETAKLSSFDCDYNNYGTRLTEPSEGVEVDRIVPRDRDRGVLYESKAIVRYGDGTGGFRRFLTMREWRAFSSLDAHSIFADPLYVSMQERDFRLLPASPNIGAGEEGATIGAHD